MRKTLHIRPHQEYVPGLGSPVLSPVPVPVPGRRHAVSHSHSHPAPPSPDLRSLHALSKSWPHWLVSWLVDVRSVLLVLTTFSCFAISAVQRIYIRELVGREAGWLGKGTERDLGVQRHSISHLQWHVQTPVTGGRPADPPPCSNDVLEPRPRPNTPSLAIPSLAMGRGGEGDLGVYAPPPVETGEMGETGSRSASSHFPRPFLTTFAPAAHGLASSASILEDGPITSAWPAPQPRGGSITLLQLRRRSISLPLGEPAAAPG